MNLGEEAVKAWEEAEFNGLESWTILWSINASANPYCRLVVKGVEPLAGWTAATEFVAVGRLPR
jgi:hypothetical protein